MLAFDLSTCPIQRDFGAGEISSHVVTQWKSSVMPIAERCSPLNTKYCVVFLSIMFASLRSILLKGTASLTHVCAKEKKLPKKERKKHL